MQGLQPEACQALANGHGLDADKRLLERLRAQIGARGNARCSAKWRGDASGSRQDRAGTVLPRLRYQRSDHGALENGVVVSFEDGKTALYSAVLLYATLRHALVMPSDSEERLLPLL